MPDNELFLYGDIGESWWGDEDQITDKQIKADLDSLPQRDSLNVFINSMGGQTHHGVAIYNILVAYSKKQKALNPNFSLSTIVDGFAYSAASIIFLAGDKRIMNPGTRNMIHNPWTIAMGDHREMQKASEALKTGRDSVADMYALVTGKKKGDIQQLMDDETYFSASEAVDFGLATEAPENKPKENNKKNPYESILGEVNQLATLRKGSYIATMLASRDFKKPEKKEKEQETKVENSTKNNFKATLDRLTMELTYDRMCA